MPKMILKQESRLNGVKTNVFNLEDVAHALRVPSSSIIKYFCSEKGANQEKESIIKGQHTYEDLLKLLDKFIHLYVLCKKCGYPEQYMILEGKKDLTAICNACGESRKLDTLHKAGKQLLKDIPNFYANNPEFKGKAAKAPSASAAVGDADGKDGKKKKKKSKKGEEAAIDEETKEEVEPEKKKKKKKAEQAATASDKVEASNEGGSLLTMEGHVTYSYEQLLERIQNQLKDRNPAMASKVKGPKGEEPNIVKLGTTKTTW
mmetsp:Transcript_69597/g.96668  ORF Transcript_69597/g.96668 Transcript_69597/m.96668 type:complete len:261 (+) Transcript_69597:144-926(+)